MKKDKHGQTLNLGDSVKLTTGGPTMMVSYVENNKTEIEVSWFAGEEYRSVYLDPAILEKMP